MATGADVARAILLELAVIDPLDPTPPELLAYVLDKANRVINNWNADHGAAYVEEFASYTLTPNLNPHTIGPSAATFTVTQRPVSIETAKLVISTPTPPARLPITPLNAEQYASITVRGVTTDIPLYLYYAAGYPNGSIYLWPIPTAAYELELWTRVVLASLAAATDVAFPPGYEDALVLSVAETLTGPLTVPMPPGLQANAAQARGRIWANNTMVPTLRTADSGMPNSGRGGGFNWLTGTGGGR